MTPEHIDQIARDAGMYPRDGLLRDAVILLERGMSARGVERVTGIHRDTICKLRRAIQSQRMTKEVSPSPTRDRRRAYRRSHPDKVNAQKRSWYYRHREEISRKRKEKYWANPEPVKERVKQWRDGNKERHLKTKSKYRNEHRRYLCARQVERNRRLDDSVVRNRLAKISRFTRRPEDFTPEEVEAKRAQLQIFRMKPGRPPCPKCGKTSRKNGKYIQSGRQRYNCIHCSLDFTCLDGKPVMPNTIGCRSSKWQKDKVGKAAMPEIQAAKQKRIIEACNPDAANLMRMIAAGRIINDEG